MATVSGPTPGKTMNECSIDQIEFPVNHASIAPIVAIGGVGGSGTRLLAAMMQSIGISMGRDLNVSLDNLGYTLLFKQAGIEKLNQVEFRNRLGLFIAANIGGMVFSGQQSEFIKSLALSPRPLHSCEWLSERAKNLLHSSALPAIDKPWGWKEPNTHICFDRLMRCFPKMKYIHVARNGVDMAFSNNQAQLTFWGESLTGEKLQETPHDSLHYWCVSHKRVFELAKAYKDRFLFLKFEDLCNRRDDTLEILLEFLNVGDANIKLQELQNLVRPPESIGRHKSHDLAQFSASDIDYVRSLGFQVNS